MNFVQHQKGVPLPPIALLQKQGKQLPGPVLCLGDRKILKRHLLGLICSIRCPGSIVIQTFDAMRALRDAGVIVVGGFHSPMERECLDILLRGSQQVIVRSTKLSRRSHVSRTLQPGQGGGL